MNFARTNAWILDILTRRTMRPAFAGVCRWKRFSGRRSAQPFFKIRAFHVMKMTKSILLSASNLCQISIRLSIELLFFPTVKTRVILLNAATQLFTEYALKSLNVFQSWFQSLPESLPQATVFTYFYFRSFAVF